MIQKQNWLLDTVRRKRRITFAELTRIWENNTELNPDRKPFKYRTFNRYVLEIQDLYGITISCNRHTNEFYISNEDAVEEGTLKNWLLDTIATENLVRESRSINDRILFEPIPMGREHLNVIIAAMKANQILKVSYHSFWSNEPYYMKLQPYFLKAYKQRWYLVGKSDRHGDELRVYGLDRIESIEVSEETFNYPKDFNPDGYCSKSFGIFLSDREPEIVKIKATDNQQSFLRTLPLHWSQKEIETTPGYSIFKYFLSPEYDFEQELLSRGGSVEVLEPKWLREEMKMIINEMQQQYK